MTRNYYTTETCDKQHIHFSGKIYLSDFCTEYKYTDKNGSSIANRIAADFKWEKNLLKKGASNKPCRN